MGDGRKNGLKTLTGAAIIFFSFLSRNSSLSCRIRPADYRRPSCGRETMSMSKRFTPLMINTKRHNSHGLFRHCTSDTRSNGTAGPIPNHHHYRPLLHKSQPLRLSPLSLSLSLSLNTHISLSLPL
ncbi:hypothetical protein L1987_10479 [Smallanthus sonchifolius]|uniref:Uncharacterized protein n=1 Tax=Smallanthus sonchifolius TaxID=185202 RepID=A0ACB9JSC6_9ASTR|nr:hypothetical protein L1987_10479 [Smallanthus sonchifolius]